MAGSNETGNEQKSMLGNAVDSAKDYLRDKTAPDQDEVQKAKMKNYGQELKDNNSNDDGPLLKGSATDLNPKESSPVTYIPSKIGSPGAKHVKLPKKDVS
jgi:hypothetical protein